MHDLGEKVDISRVLAVIKVTIERMSRSSMNAVLRVDLHMGEFFIPYAAVAELAAQRYRLKSQSTHRASAIAMLD